MKVPLISLQVTPDIATKIRFLAESGIFTIDTGNATLNIKDGLIKSIKTELYSYPHVDSGLIDKANGILTG